MSPPFEIALDHVRLGYPGQAPLPPFSARIPGQARTAIAGANGAGKSTLLKAIAGIIKPAQGTIRRSSLETLAYLPQASELPRDFPIDVEGLVAMGHWRRRGAWRRIGAAERHGIASALERVGLEAFAQRPLAALSAGQFQRALFARLIVEDAELILLDEPFNAVDAATTERLLGLIETWHGEGRTVLCALHDKAQIARWFEHCLTLDATGAHWNDLPRAGQVAPPKVIPLYRKENLL